MGLSTDVIADSHCSVFILAALLAASLCAGCSGSDQPTEPCDRQMESKCDGEDNDNDGVVDDGCTCRFNGSSRGVCSDGVRSCEGNCQKPDGYESEEASCDGADNDCDGQVDEAFPQKGDACDGSDDDQCRYGTYACSDDGEMLVCSSEEKTDISEVCGDDEDNDCDGETDEDCTCNFQGKSTGVCQTQQRTDQGGECPKPDEYQKEETRCDGLDNDCDGYVDGLALKCPGQAGALSTREDEKAYAVAFDTKGRLYMAGWTDANDTRTKREGYWARFSPSGEREKLVSFGSVEFDNFYDIDVGPDGEIVAVGESFGDFDSQQYSGGDDEDGDFAIVKFDAAGQQEWVRLLGGTGGEQARAVAIDDQGGIYVAGETKSDLGSSNVGSSDVAVTKYDSDGNRAWLKQIGTAVEDSVDGIALDNTGGIAVVGHTPGAFPQTTNSGNSDAFVARFDTDGTPQGVTLFGTSSFDAANAVVADPDGTLYVAGETEGDLRGQTYQGGSGDGFIAKIGSNGNFKWTRIFGGPDGDFLTALALGPDGDVHFTGGTEGSLPNEENSGGWDGVVGKYDPLGNLSRSDLVGSGDDDWLQAIEVSKNGKIAVGGYSKGNLADNGAGDEFDAVMLW